MSYLFDEELLENRRVECNYYMGIDNYDKNNPAYCLTRMLNGVAEVLLCKVVHGEKEFNEEVNNIAKYFNAIKITEDDKNKKK